MELFIFSTIMIIILSICAIFSIICYCTTTDIGDAFDNIACLGAIIIPIAGVVGLSIFVANYCCPEYNNKYILKYTYDDSANEYTINMNITKIDGKEYFMYEYEQIIKNDSIPQKVNSQVAVPTDVFMHYQKSDTKCIYLEENKVKYYDKCTYTIYFPRDWNVIS